MKKSNITNKKKNTVGNNTKSNSSNKSTIKNNKNDIDDLSTQIFNFYHEALSISSRVQASLGVNDDITTDENTSKKFDNSFFKGNDLTLISLSSLSSLLL